MANPKSFGLGTDEEAILFVRNLENLRFVAFGLGGGEWGRVATANVIQRWHVEDAGKASMLQLCRGLGCLVFAQPKIGSDREGFLRVGFEEAEDEGWDYYNVILESGDCWWVKQPMRYAFRLTVFFFWVAKVYGTVGTAPFVHPGTFTA